MLLFPSIILIYTYEYEDTIVSLKLIIMVYIEQETVDRDHSRREETFRRGWMKVVFFRIGSDRADRAPPGTYVIRTGTHSCANSCPRYLT